ncbi:glycosyltransferase [Candidatus Pelagibacter sp.]|jgi:glycosyltransferase involved in cell wall biosynthesis|nr:glycosyltransferase [Candidatus Pelagibacter sp.]
MNKKICFPFVGDTLGGSHISSLELIKQLKRSNHQVDVVLHKKGALFNYLKNKKIEFKFLKIDNMAGQSGSILHTIYLLFKNFYLLRGYIKKNKVDLVHGNDLRINLSWGFASIYNVVFIWHQRTIFKKMSLLIFPIYFFSDYIISISKTVKNSLPKILHRKTKVIFNPISVKKINRKINKKKINICFVSRPTFEKGFDLFLKIIEKINDKRIYYNIYLSRDIRKTKKRIRFLKNNNKINVHGFTKFENIAKKNEILIAPSYSEGFGRTIIEASICKMAVIASRIDAHKEISKNFVKINIVKNEYQNYLNCIKKILNKQKTSFQLIKNLDYFSVKSHYFAIKKIYEKV